MKQNLIGGLWSDTAAAKDDINPSDIHDVVGVYTQADEKQVELAVEAAGSAASEWASSTPQQRFDVLDIIGSEILDRKKELGQLLAREDGRTLPEGIGEVGRAGQLFKFCAGGALRMSG